jgi:hypothetical protein
VLCEGNSCLGGDEGQTPGNGTILVLSPPILASGKWDVVDSIQLPEINAGFEDYSGLDIYDNKWVAVVSQQDSKLWVGQLASDSWSILGDGSVFAFPKTLRGDVQFCNVEGVSWINATQVVIVTDQNSNPPCNTYSESICTFSIPNI